MQLAKISLYLASFTLLLYIAAFSSPWWFETVEGKSTYYHVNGKTWRCNNRQDEIADGRGKRIFETNAALIASSSLPMIILLISPILWLSGYKCRLCKFISVAFGLAAFGLITAALIQFGVGLPIALDLDGLFGKENLLTTQDGMEVVHIKHYGASAGFFLAIITIPFLVASCIAIALIDESKKPIDQKFHHLKEKNIKIASDDGDKQPQSA